MAIVKRIKMGDRTFSLTGLLTFDEVDESDQHFDPDIMTLNDRLKAATTDKERLPLAKQILATTRAQRDFIKKMLTKYVQMSPADRKTLGYAEAFVLYQMLYQASVEVPENLKLPSGATSGSDSTLQKTSTSSPDE